VDLSPAWQLVGGCFFITCISRVYNSKQEEGQLEVHQESNEDHEDAVKQGVGELSVELLPVHVVALLE